MDEACRNIVAVGGRPHALTDCLNFGNPEKPEVYWELSESIDGLAEACRALDVPLSVMKLDVRDRARGTSLQAAARELGRRLLEASAGD